MSSWTQNTVLRSTTRTAITFAYELGLERSLARWKTNENLHPKIAKTSSTPCRCALSEFWARVLHMHTPNTPHNGSEPMPLQGPITRARARQSKLSSWTQTSITVAYELGLERSLARWKANEKLHPKIAKTSSTPFRRAFGILPCRCESFENDEFH